MGVKGLLLADHEEVPHDFGIRTGDLGDTAVGAGNHGRPAQLSIDYWEELGEVSCGLLFCFFSFWKAILLTGTL